MAAKLTPLAVQNAKPKKRGGALLRNEIPDRGLPGLFLIVQPSQVKSWALRYRINGRSRKLTLGGADPATGLSLAAARVAAAQARERIGHGIDPAAEKRSRRLAKPAPADSIEAAVERFLELHARRKLRATSLRATEDYFRRLILPAWRGRTIHSIKRKDVIALVEDIAATRPVTANRVLSALSKFFNWSMARDAITSSPVNGVERPGIEKPRDRTLDDSEIAQLWTACAELGVAGSFIRMLLLIGCRRSEVAGMKWSEIDTEKRVWTLPAERSKNKLAHKVALSTQAWDIIQALPRISDYVFSATGKGPLRNFDWPKTLLDRKLTFTKPWVLHDCRRSVASGLQRLGTRVEVIEACLNHRSGVFRGIVGIYQRHDFADETRVALQRWADHIARLVGGKPAKIIRFKSDQGGTRPAP
jgi:integrase